MGAAERVVALDTSVVVAALLAAHEQHSVAAPFVAALRRGPGLVLPLPVLAESYAVLTRLPTPLRLERHAVVQALSQTFQQGAEVTGLGGALGWGLIQEAAHRDLVGGATYDLHVALCARLAGATHVATFNRRHFERIGLEGLSVIVPGQPGGA